VTVAVHRFAIYDLAMMESASDRSYMLHKLKQNNTICNKLMI